MTARERRQVVAKIQATKSVSERRSMRRTGFPRSTNFLVRLPESGRFVTVGTPTAASTGQPLVFSLPDRTPLVKHGIVPDLVVEPTVEEVRAGADPVLTRALEWLSLRRGVPGRLRPRSSRHPRGPSSSGK